MKLLDKNVIMNDNLDMKTCSKCGIEKTLDMFSPDARNKRNGRQARCKLCMNEADRDYYKNNADECRRKLRDQYRLNPEKKKEIERRYRERNPEKITERTRRYRATHAEQCNERCKRWIEQNYEKHKETGRLWIEHNKEKYAATKNRWIENNKEVVLESWRKYGRKRSGRISHRLSHNIGSGMWRSITTGKDGLHWESLVDFTLNDLRQHLEKQFKNGISWENYGEWEIDHIIPIKAFNFEKPEDLDFKRCWALTNLQPLWAGENRAKRDRLDYPFQPSLTIAI